MAVVVRFSVEFGLGLVPPIVSKSVKTEDFINCPLGRQADRQTGGLLGGSNNQPGKQ